MKRARAILLAVVFVVGMLVLPTLHMAHCEGHAGHDSSHCELCQLVNAPLHDAKPQVGPIADPIRCVVHALSPRLVISAVPGCSAQARAPPVA